MHVLPLFIRIGDCWRVWSKVGSEYGKLKAKVGKAEESNLLPPISGWDSDSTIECSREFLPAIEKWERRKEEERIRKGWEPLASEVGTAAETGDIARVKELQQLQTSGIVIIIIIVTISPNR